MSRLLIGLLLTGFEPGSDPSVQLVISKSAFSLSVRRGDSVLYVFPVALGKMPGDKERVGDNRTPEGEFFISRIHDSRAWVHDFNDGKGPIAGAYGPWFLRLETSGTQTRSGRSWTGIGIHGTHDETSIGTMATEGCIRLRTEHLEVVRRVVRVGTKVIIE